MIQHGGSFGPTLHYACRSGSYTFERQVTDTLVALLLMLSQCYIRQLINTIGKKHWLEYCGFDSGLMKFNC